jgi:GT2 family glycosyltransferase
MNKILSIIIPVFNKFAFTKACLNDLSKLPNDHEIIIIDNASIDETNTEIIKILDQCDIDASICRMNYFKNSENVFHSRACNQGFQKARGENILFLNNDIRVRSNHANWTKSIIDACNSINGLVGPTMGQLDNNLNFIKEANKQLTGNSYLGGWCIAAKRDVWENLKIGDTDQIWNEDFPFYFNDTDLSFRAREKNIPLTVISLPDIVHFGKISAAQINVHKLYTEGRQIFVKKWKK